ncbi:hypothetical protein LX32DRAFT_343103 [Colletotrichum zoysiae]|uniref:Uncharacterized protein n=1 Tax=Colletotrichum zoysiae TaxID=1216348 RepID=A0AAD9HKW2_9PEZI|nr:hypothetical protein LX32DRAFT_343103 [Colletotrichum zoysiae]
MLETLTKCHQHAVVVPAAVSHYVIFLPSADHCPRFRGIVGQCRKRQGRAPPGDGCLIAGRFPTGGKCRILGTACLFSWPVTQHGFPLSSALASARSWPASEFGASKMGCTGLNPTGRSPLYVAACLVAQRALISSRVSLASAADRPSLVDVRRPGPMVEERSLPHISFTPPAMIPRASTATASVDS